MKGGKFGLVVVVIFMLLATAITTAVAQPGPQISGIAPIAPNGFIMTKTPVFSFIEESGATKYKIKVINTATSLVMYTFSGAGTCTAGTCTLQPTTPLNNAKLNGQNGHYRWKVRAYVSGVWQPFSTTLDFTVISTGFNSTFTVDMNKWKVIYGTWNIVAPGYLKTKGNIPNYVSVAEKELTTDHLVYEVKMKRLASADGPNYLYLMGNPYPLNLDEYMDWNKYYSISFNNNQLWWSWRADGNNYLQLKAYTTDTHIKPYDWNIVLVWVDYPKIHVWINDWYLGYINDPTYTSGFVGVGMEKDTPEGCPLQVDYAKTYYSNIAPIEIPTLSNGNPDPAFEFKYTETHTTRSLPGD
ncbi:MAG: hypothetical protein KBG10_01075 [Anaerolineaceae bacterium]|nr:hypothetical protein [Anaerolineaceae bacterium]